AGRGVRRDIEPPLLDVNEEFTPALRALAYSSLEADKFLLALGCRADQHQHAFGIVFHPSLQVDPVRPHVHVSPRREVQHWRKSFVAAPAPGFPFVAGDSFSATSNWEA